jgi:hypothetical protein
MLVDAARAAFVDAARTQETAEIDAWLASRPP